jgi:hypothetical protein
MLKEDAKGSKMQQPRTTNRNIAIALGTVCVLLIIGWAATLAIYTSLINTKDDLISSDKSLILALSEGKDALQGWLDGNLSLLNSQISRLNQQISDLQNQTASAKAQISDLQNQTKGLKAPRLITVNLVTSDNRPVSGTPFLHVRGYVCNVGIDTAYNSTIHVEAYRVAGILIIDTDIDLGSIAGESWKSVDTDIYYTGNSLTSWTTTLQWTSS